MDARGDVWLESHSKGGEGGVKGAWGLERAVWALKLLSRCV